MKPLPPRTALITGVASGLGRPLALFWTTKAFLPAMPDADRGHLVTIASAAGLIGVRTRVPWLLPILKPHQVVKVILRSVRRGRRRVILPWFVYSVLWLRGLPAAALDVLADLFGINQAMDRFTGRPTAQEKQK